MTSNEAAWQFVVRDAATECMAADGFDIDLNTVLGLGGDEGGDGGGDGASSPLDDETFVLRYGYGITTGGEEEPLPEPAPDPLAALAPAEREAAMVALYGSSDASAQPSPDSCLGRGMAEGATFRERFDTRLLELLGGFTERVSADPRVVASADGWVRCMSAAGYDGFASSMDAAAEVARRASEAASEEEFLAVQEFELTLAATDFGCLQETIEVRRQVEAELAPGFAAEVERIILDEG